MQGSAWKKELRSAARPQSTARLAALGIGQGTLRSRGWRKVSRGFYVPASAGRVVDDHLEKGVTDPQRKLVRFSTAQRILDVTPLLTGTAALGTWAAAYVLGVDWLDGRSPHTMKEQSIDVIAPDLKRRPARGLTYHCSELPQQDAQVRDGIRVTAPCRTTFDGARWAPSLEEAVVFIDTMLAFRMIESSHLEAYAREHPGWTGVEQALTASQYARPGVGSGWETRLRLCWLLDARLPTPMVNQPIFDRSERFLGIADLFDAEAGLVAEFDGDQHRNPSQHRKDNIREEKFESANLVVVRADKVDVRHHRAQLVARLVDGHRRGQLRDRRLDKWTLAQPGWWIRTRPRAYG